MPSPITVPLLFFILVGLQPTGWAQGCPKVQACPIGLVTICDLSDNNPGFWNDSLFTWSPTLNSRDLSESSADLSLWVRDTCPGNLTFQFSLFFDLDGDNLAESVLNSHHVLPAGRMLFGNAFTPGYGGTDTLEFDSRLVPDSMKFRFVVEQQQTGDTVRAFLRWVTDMAPASYLSPRLPEGRHRILWTVEKNGLPVAFCEYSFRVKDCMEPQLACLGSWNASLMNADTLWLSVQDFLSAATDNITPDSLLIFGLRRPGTGTGFPFDNFGKPVTKLPFTCSDIGIQQVELWARDLAGNNSLCTAEFVLYDFLNHCDAVDPIVCATTIFVDNDTIQGVRYKLEIVQDQGLPPVHLTHTPLPNGCVELPDFSPYFIDVVAVTPRKNDDPLNGVSTFDLVLINRHILGVQIFNKTWKYLAADANNSNTISTFDIIELRKLILGQYDTLPNSSSWKFIIADCALDSINPLTYVCPGTLIFDPDFPPKQYLFMGIKTGDVNGNASPDSLQSSSYSRSPAAYLEIPDRNLEAGVDFELSLSLRDPVEWVGCQWALTWDPASLEISAAEPGIFPGSGQAACSLPKPGALRFNWFDSKAQWLFPDLPLLRIRGTTKRALRLSEVLQLASLELRPEAYKEAGELVPLDLAFVTGEKPGVKPVIYPPQPNPTSAGTVFPVYPENPAQSILEIWSPDGRLVYRDQENLDAGAGKLVLADEVLVTPGVYVWRIQVGNATKTGRLIRL